MPNHQSQIYGEEHSATRYRSEQLVLSCDAMEAALALADSVEQAEYIVYEREGKWHFAAEPLYRLRVLKGQLHIATPRGEKILRHTNGDWGAIDKVLRQLPIEGWRAYGYATFEAATLNVRPCEDVVLDLMIPSREAIIDREEITLRAVSEDGLTMMQSALTKPHMRTLRHPAGVTVDVQDHSYIERVTEAVKRIHTGLLAKVILSRVVPVPFEVDMLATFAAGRRANQPVRSFVLRFGGWEAAGFSPERVLEVTPERKAITQPLAGTRAMTGEDVADDRLRRELLGDPKEVYEHATSVRLAMEELGIFGERGSTCISEFMEVRQRGSVQHIASQVETKIADSNGVWDALGVVFPAITASGIPKREALQAIHDLEESPRGLYAGSVFTASSDGSLDSALVLRSVYQRGGRAWLQAGAGIVGLSQPEREHEETCEKLRSIAPYVVRRDDFSDDSIC